LGSAPIDALLNVRDDIFLVYTGPAEYPLSPANVAERSNLVIGTNYGIIGEGFVMQAMAMGAETIVHYSFPRHLYTPFIAERRDAMRAAAEREGIPFIERAALDPMESGFDPAIAHIEEDLPKQVAELGINTAFFGTACVMQGAILSQVMGTGAIFVQACCPLSPYHAHVSGLGIAYRIPADEDPDTPLLALTTLIQAINNAVEVGDMSGRISGWAVPGNTLWTTIGFMYAVEWINNNVPQEHGIICPETLERLAREYIAELGFDSGVTLETLSIDGTATNHIIFGMVDYYLFGDK